MSSSKNRREVLLKTNFSPTGNFTNDRLHLKNIVITKFIEELPGSKSRDKLNMSYYKYHVETLTNGNKVHLLRPAYGKKGFDFLISVEGLIFKDNRSKSSPGHSDIYYDLTEKQRTEREKYRILYGMIHRVYLCEEPDDIIQDCGHLQFDAGFCVESLLKMVKWFFLEQDIRYWNYQGREKFFEDKVPHPDSKLECMENDPTSTMTDAREVFF